MLWEGDSKKARWLGGKLARINPSGSNALVEGQREYCRSGESIKARFFCFWVLSFTRFRWDRYLQGLEVRDSETFRSYSGILSKNVERGIPMGKRNPLIVQGRSGPKSIRESRGRRSGYLPIRRLDQRYLR